MEKVRLAVLGCGAVTQIHHLPAISRSEFVEAAVVVDADAPRAYTLAKRFGVPQVATDWRVVLDRVEAAIVALPNNLHAPVAVELLRRGIHVLLEKPMALSVRECDEIIAAAKAGKAVLAVGLDFRFFDSTWCVKDLLEEGLLGELRGFDLRLGLISRWPFATDFLLRKESAGGGVLTDWGVHVLDLLLVWLGDWESVDYRDDARAGIESDCEMRLSMRSGIKGTAEISRTRNLRNTCIFEGKRTTLEVGIWDPDPAIALRFASRGRRDVRLTGHAQVGPSTSRTWQDVFVCQVDDFAAAIRAGREPLVPGCEGRRSIELIEACHAARKPLALPWDDPPELAAWESA